MSIQINRGNYLILYTPSILAGLDYMLIKYYS